MDAAIGEDQTKHLSALSAMGIDIPNTAAAAVGIDTHTKTDNVRLVPFPSGKRNGPISNKSKGSNNNDDGTKVVLRLPRQLRTEREKALRIGKLMPIRDLRSAGAAVALSYCIAGK